MIPRCPACESGDLYVTPASVYNPGSSDRWVCADCWVTGELLLADGLVLLTIDKQLEPPLSW